MTRESTSVLHHNSLAGKEFELTFRELSAQLLTMGSAKDRQ